MAEGRTNYALTCVYPLIHHTHKLYIILQDCQTHPCHEYIHMNTDTLLVIWPFSYGHAHSTAISAYYANPELTRCVETSLFDLI